jgi:hypothetical protein
MSAMARGLFPVLLLALASADGQETAKLNATTPDGRLAPLLANLGNLRCPVTTQIAEAQRFFDQGLTLVYAFNHAEALRSFREAARLDPSCAMAYWGQALALSPNINDSAIGPDREQQGYAAIQQAVLRKKGASAKEVASIDALASRFSVNPPQDRSTLNLRYATAMRTVYEHFSDNPDIAVLYADAVMNTRPWDYWDRNGRPHAGSHLHPSRTLSGPSRCERSSHRRRRRLHHAVPCAGNLSGRLLSA